MQVYGMELRQRVMDDYVQHKDDKKVTMKVLAKKWKVSVEWIKKLLRQQRETGSYAPIVAKVGRKQKLAAHTDELKKIIKDNSDATLVEIQEKLSVKVSLPTIHRALRQLRI
ncbi:MAG: IS630 transposase-related protein, partial [Thermoguttaceae bacterium]